MKVYSTSPMWEVMDSGGLHHIMPLLDTYPHDTGSCWCHPTEDDEEHTIMVHHSHDGREAFERGERLLS
jgi:hypothetical protein